MTGDIDAFDRDRVPDAEGRVAGISCDALRAQLEVRVEDADSAYERASLVFAIGDLGGTPRRWLDDPVPAVRGCAALAETLAGDDAATKVLLDVSRSPRAFAASLGGAFGPPAFSAAPFQDLIARAVVRRVREPSVLLSSALAAVDVRPSTAIALLAPYLRVFFPVGRAQLELDPLQRAFAASIAERDELWGPPERDLAALFKPCSLSARRADWVAMADSRPQSAPETYSAANIVVSEGFAAIRKRPEMYFGVKRTDPDLPEHILAVLRTEYAHAVAEGVVGLFTVEVQSPTRLPLDVLGYELPGMRSVDHPDMECVFGRLSDPLPAFYLTLVSAVCQRVGVREWFAGRVLSREYVDTIALDATRVSAADESRTGYQVVFDLDTDWFPAGSRFKSA